MSLLGRHRAYGPDDLLLAEEIASRVAVGLENARLYAVAQEAVQARDELLVVAAHELRTPLTALQLTADQFVRSAVRRGDAPAVAQGEKMARHVRRFAALVSHILDALNIRTDALVLSQVPVDLATVVRERVDRIAERARAEGSPITVDGVSNLTCSLDRATIEKALDALLDNAVKFGAGKPVRISVRVDGPWAEIAVHDEGIGIPPERTTAIFLPFERATHTEHFGGLGLGLFIARAIVEAHGGSIGVTSNPVQGTTFTMRLPIDAGGHGHVSEAVPMANARP
jgi:signal transduction histidine kinase